ncbi:hypothetical protein [Paraburkholderia kirstenboschensis]|uniref:Uncharacterized protein n=1 Tax=Paraburkholderia kirstenboschensis TaxID=1245436 RepID=A0ABZ0EFE6_9BURK|nr:hypothetical protein [Paraburkholderia kirstenboschensis]WOD15946.1 hypothetical protein RW095_22210 [Paraburkholderia kirstenboschensis]
MNKIMDVSATTYAGAIADTTRSDSGGPLAASTPLLPVNSAL